MWECSHFVANPKPRRNKSAKKAADYLESTENPFTFASDLRFIHKLELVFWFIFAYVWLLLVIFFFSIWLNSLS